MQKRGLRYKDPRWQRKRLEILDRDNFACVACGATDKELHVHHIKYAAELWEADTDDLQTLCTACHSGIGPHPKGGIKLLGDCGWHYTYTHCPMCGFDGEMKEKGSYDKCTQCGHVIVPEMCDCIS